MAEIRWSEIEAECGGFRSGFVAVFRKYEGQPTDEKDGQGRTVKVTARSFASHCGVAESTFRDWLRSTTAVDLLPSQAADRKADSVARSAIQRMTSKDKAELVKQAIASDRHVAAVAREAVLSRAIDERPAVHNDEGSGVARHVIKAMKEDDAALAFFRARDAARQLMAFPAERVIRDLSEGTALDVKRNAASADEVATYFADLAEGLRSTQQQLQVVR